MDRACQSASIAAMAWLVIACWDLGALTEGADPGARDDASADVAVTESGAPDVTDAAGDGGAESGKDDDAGVDAGASWKLYSRNHAFAPDVWVNDPLAAVWVGPNAPPSRNIRATTKLNVVDRLIVITDDKVYIRASQEWQTPLALTAKMPLLVGKSFTGALHLTAKADAAMPTEYITFADNPTAYIYETDGTNFEYFQSRPLNDSPAPISAPQGSKQSRWVVTKVNPAALGSPGYLNVYEAYEGDGNVYFYDATPAFTNKWAFKDCPLFAGTTGPPPEADIMAGWHDDATDVTYLIVR